MSNEQPDAKVIPFPRQLRIARVERRPYAAPADGISAAVEHDGRTYGLKALLRQLPAHRLRQVEATAPRSGQELWDEVVRRWPGTANEIVAGTGNSTKLPCCLLMTRAMNQGDTKLLGLITKRVALPLRTGGNNGPRGRSDGEGRCGCGRWRGIQGRSR